MKLLCKKRSFILLEILLAFSILSMILAFLFNSLKTSALLNTKCDTLQRFFFTRHHIQERLSQIFSNIEPCLAPLLEKGESAFYTCEEPCLSLYFTFNHGIDPEESFTGTVQGRIFLEKNTLILELTPTDPHYLLQKRREILLTNVESLSFLFYQRPSLVQRTKNTSSSGAFELLSKWPIDYPDIPYCITLSLKLQDKSTLDYSFYLSSSIQPIRYDS
ncbi:MAG: type II secretion system protein [Chlamydiota bacterium]